MRTLFLSLHVLGGVAGLLLGGFALRPPATPQFRFWIRTAYTAAIVVLASFLTATVIVDWPSINPTQRIVYGLLIALAVFIVARVGLAYALAQRQRGQSEAKYVNHIYFSYVSLWEGFFIVGLLDLGAPTWLIVLVAIGVLVLGAYLLNRFRRGLSAKLLPQA